MTTSRRLFERDGAGLRSQDLKTPLATVVNLCDEVLDEFSGAIPVEARSMVERAREAAYRLSRRIDELLAELARADSPVLGPPDGQSGQAGGAAGGASAARINAIDPRPEPR